MTLKAEQGGDDCKNQSEVKCEGVTGQMIRSDSREAQGPMGSEGIQGKAEISKARAIDQRTERGW